MRLTFIQIELKCLIVKQESEEMMPELCAEGQRQLKVHNELEAKKWIASANLARDNFEAHINICPMCQEALAQMN